MLLSLLFLFCVYGVGAVTLSATQEFLATAEANSSTVQKVIILDAGHGGFDGGAQAADGTKEKDINLAITLKLAEFYKLGGFDVILTRSADMGTETDPNDTIAHRKVSDMKNRLALLNANPNGLFVSVHLNKFTTSSVSGAQVFYSPNNDNSYHLAESLQKSLIKHLQPDNNRTVKKSDKTIYLLKNAKIPAVIVECGFLSNKQELELLKTNDYQSKLAFSLYCGTLEYFNNQE